MNYNLALEQFGLNQKETKIYTTLLQMGSGTIQEIVRKSGIKRTTTYSVLENLMQKKLINLLEKDTKREYFAEDPKNIISILETKEKALSEKKKQLLEALPEIKSLYNIHTKKPKVRFYENDEGIKFVLDATLDLPKGSETLSYQTDEKLPSKFLQEYVFDYVKRRIAKGISQRMISNDSPFLQKMQQKDKVELRNTTMINAKIYPFTDQVIIFGDKVAIVSYSDQIALIIESQAVAQTQKTIFELAWAGAQKLGKPSPNPYIPPKNSARG